MRSDIDVIVPLQEGAVTIWQPLFTLLADGADQQLSHSNSIKKFQLRSSKKPSLSVVRNLSASL